MEVLILLFFFSDNIGDPSNNPLEKTMFYKRSQSEINKSKWVGW